MEHHADTADGSVAFILAGICLALFMLLHPFDQLAGAHGAEQGTWIPAHTAHFLGALFALFGLSGLYRTRLARRRSTKLAVTTAATGTAMLLGTGMLTAFVWPSLAAHSPTFVAADGPIFQDALPKAQTVATYALLALGYVAVAVVVRRERVLPTVGSVLIGGGVVLFSVPVQPLGPFPWIVRVVGGVLFGAGLVWLGVALRRPPSNDS